MKTVHSLKIYPSITEALKAINLLEDAFLKAHKRKPRTELTLAVLSSPFDRSKKRVGPKVEPAEVRAYVSPDSADELLWFVNFLK